MKVIKLGGTSLQTPTLINNAIQLIKSYNTKVIVIVSAIGRKGFPYATDTLIDSLKGCYLSPKEKDRLLSLGEIYASAFLSNELNKAHIYAYSLSYREIGILCDRNYNQGNIVSLNKEKIKQYINKYQVLVVPGFIAKSNEYEVITLGRGASDLSAVILSDLVEEKEVTLFKDIDGIYPTIQYPLTKIDCFEYLSYDEALSLTRINYFVINKKALCFAKENSIKIIVRNYKLNNKMTCISERDSSREVIGFNQVNNTYYIACKNPEKVRDEIDDLFRKRHIFIKKYGCLDGVLEFPISSSQTLLIRQLILNTYFKEFLK